MDHTFRLVALATALGVPALIAGCLNATDTGNCSATIPVHAYTVGETATDTLTARTCRQMYLIAPTVQTNLRVTVTSPGYQTFLQLYDSRGAIVMNSALTNDLDTTTTVRLMVGPGTYEIAVNPVNTGDGGPYHLTSTLDSAAVAGCSPVWVTTGITTTQTITTSDCTQGPLGGAYYTHAYALVLLVGQEITLTESSTVFPPGMVLSGGGTALPSTVDNAGTTASISTVIATQAAYTVWVGSSSAGQTGSYTLQIQ